MNQQEHIRLIGQAFAQEFPSVSRPLYEAMKERKDKLEAAITAYLDAWWDDRGEQQARQRLRELVDWVEEECVQRLNAGALPDDYSTGNRI